MAKILHVDDDEFIRQLFSMSMKFHNPNINAVQVSDLRGATAALEAPEHRDGFLLVLSDFNFPGKKDDGSGKDRDGGIDLLTYVTEKKIPSLFAFVTSHDEDKIRDEGARLGLRQPDAIFQKGQGPLPLIVAFIEAAARPQKPDPKVERSRDDKPSP